MNKKNIGILILLFLLIGIIAILLVFKSNNNPVFNVDNEVDNTGNNSINNESIDQENIFHLLNKVDNYDIFFTMNELVNNYYSLVAEKDKDSLLKIVYNHDSFDYDQINDYYNNYENISFVSNNMYEKGVNNIYYYFMDGITFSYDMDVERLYTTPAQFMIVIDTQNNTFSIESVEISSLEVYANAYQVSNKSISKNDLNAFEYLEVSDERIVKNYIHYYQNLLYLNTEKAYSMLSSDMISKYSNIEEFNMNLSNIYAIFSRKIMGFEANGTSGRRKYYVLTNNDIRIVLQEKSIMDFTVTIEES